MLTRQQVAVSTRRQVAEPREVAMLEEKSIERKVPARELAAGQVAASTRQQVAEPREVAMLEETSIEQVVPARAQEAVQVSEQVVAFFQQ